MHLRRVRLGLVCCIYAGMAALAGDEPESNPQAQRLASLIKQLGHDEFAQREVANRALVALGEPALGALRKAAVSDPDLEIRKRAIQVSRAILQAVSKSKSTLMQLAIIEAGTFEMGSPLNEPNRRPDEASHKVRITRPFLMGVYEVTQDEFSYVMQSRPSWFAPLGGGAEKIISLGLDSRQFPVEMVSWYDAIEFCNKLSKLDGYEPRYVLNEVQRDGNSIKFAKVVLVPGNGYHLPTEAQWEYACRAGSTTAFHFGAVNTGKSANYRPGPPTGYGTTQSWTALQRTAKVGSYPPNLFGLFDMHGNVAEWCWDLYDKDYYMLCAPEDPPGPNTGDHRLLRGGSWMIGESACRAATRFYHAPDERKEYTGFRVARTP